MSGIFEFGKETRLKGLAISGGTALARVCLFNEARHSNLPVYKVEGEGTDREVARFERAVELAAGQLEEIRKDVTERIGQAEGEIFVAQKTIVSDGRMVGEIKDLIREQGLNAESAVTNVLDRYEARLLEVNSKYINERASDIGEVKRRLLDVLGNMNPSLQCGDAEHCQKGHNRIIIAEELTPTLTMALDTAHTLGFVTERGGLTSHAAILARALGIPAVSGVEGIHGMISCGTEVILNGDTGELIVWPKEETIVALPEASRAPLEPPEIAPPVPGMRVMANISLSSDVREVRDAKAEGIGLYRTEFEFMAAQRMLGEDEQFEHYAAVLKAMDGEPVYFRLADLGGDKPLPFLDLPREENPYLGCRGSRLLLTMPELLRSQARALARASAFGPVNVMYPMVVDVEQFLKLKGVFLDAVQDVTRGEVRHGVMFEVPSACMQARELLEVADFGSIGSNDLIQYLFAVDRNNEMVAADYDPAKPVFWALVGQIADAARAAGKELSLCGELAGDPEYMSRLAEAGLTRISVSPRLIGGVRRAAKEALA